MEHQETRIEHKIYSDMNEMFCVLRNNSAAPVQQVELLPFAAPKYKLIIISNKRYPFTLSVDLDDTITAIKHKINSKTKDDVKLLSLYHHYLRPTYCANYQTLRDLYAPQMLALEIETCIHFTIKYYASPSMHYKSSFKQFASENLLDAVIDTTDNECILTSLICKHDDEQDKHHLIYGFLRRDMKQPSNQARRIHIPLNLLQLMARYYFMDKSKINIFRSLEDNHVSDEETIVLYPDLQQKYVKYSDLDDECQFGITIQMELGKRVEMEVNRQYTVERLLNEFSMKEGIFPEQCILIFNGQRLSFHDKLIEHHIGPNTTIFLRMRCRGS